MFGIAQNSYIDSVQSIRDENVKELFGADTQILNDEEKSRVQSLDYYAIDISKKVDAVFTEEKGRSFHLPTSSGTTKLYRKYGYVTFDWDGKKVKLTIYQDINLSKKQGFEDYLIIPFKDATSGKETYGGGRYLDFRMTNQSTVEIDFNLAYNPYCAYSYRYNCPIPPEENHLKISIDAGEKTPIEQ
jgi:uncharacterized protein (DUF1684 family)